MRAVNRSVSEDSKGESVNQNIFREYIKKKKGNVLGQIDGK